MQTYGETPSSLHILHHAPRHTSNKHMYRMCLPASRPPREAPTCIVRKTDPSSISDSSDALTDVCGHGVNWYPYVVSMNLVGRA